MTAEEWRPVKGFPGYQVSNLGRLGSILRTSAGVARILACPPSTGGYRLVTLRRDGRNHTRRLHGLVAEAFHGPRPDGLVARHINGDRLDNRASNLRWGTPSENALDTVRHGRNPNARKTRCVSDHPFTEVNTYIDPLGRRQCRECRRRRNREAATRRAFRAAGFAA